MANNTRKISELSSKGIVPESALLPVAVASAEKETYRTTLNNLRANLLFENAYETLAEGIAATVKDEIFYVYTDDSQFYVAAFTNVNGASATALYKDNTPVIYGTGKMMADGKFGSYTSYVSYLYNNGSANGGETEIALPFDCFDVSEMFLNGGHQFKGLNYTFDRLSNKVKLKGALTAGAFVVFYVRPYPGTPITPVEPGITDYVNVTWLYNDGAAVGGETSLTPPWTFSTVPAIYINGSKQVLNKHYEVDSTGLKINLSKALKANDVVEVLLGGSRSIITAQVSGTPAEILLTLGQTTGATKVNTSYGVSLEQVVQGFYGVNSFDDLRNRRPNFDGEKVALKSYRTGIKTGGGYFIGRIGTGQLEDYGIIAVGNGFYWERVIAQEITPEMFGAAGDGVTDDLSALTNSINRSVSLGYPLILTSTYAISSVFVIPSRSRIIGVENLSKIVALGGWSDAVVKTTNAPSGDYLTLTNAGAEVLGVTIENLIVEGNWGGPDDTVNTHECAMKIWGTGTKLKGVRVGYCSGVGLKAGGKSTTSIRYGAPSLYSDIRVDFVGEDGIVIGGSSDNHSDKFVVRNAGLKAHKTYDGIRFGGGGGTRGDQFHVWQSGDSQLTPYYTNRVRYGLYLASYDSLITNCHFEGAAGAQICFAGARNAVLNTRVYSNWEPGAVVIFLNDANSFHGYVGAPINGTTATQVHAFQIGDSTTQVKTYRVDAYIYGVKFVNFVNSTGRGFMRLQGDLGVDGTSGMGTIITGTVPATDMLEINSIQYNGIQCGMNIVVNGGRSITADTVIAQSKLTFSGISTTAPSDTGGIYKDSSGNVKVK